MFGGHSIPVAQLGPDFLLLDAPTDHPPGPASILLCVDQSQRRWDVRLPDGISATSKRVAITACVKLAGRPRAEHRFGIPRPQVGSL